MSYKNFEAKEFYEKMTKKEMEKNIKKVLKIMREIGFFSGHKDGKERVFW